MTLQMDLTVMLWILVAILVADAPWLEISVRRAVGIAVRRASIAMVMQYWNAHQPGADSRASDERVIYEALPAIRGKGIAGDALRRYLELHNFDAHVFNGELDDLRRHLSQGRPVVVWPGAARENVVRCISRWRRESARRDLAQ